MNKRLGTLVASVVLVAVAEVGSGASSTAGRLPPSYLPPKPCVQTPLSTKRCPPPQLPPYSSQRRAPR